MAGFEFKVEVVFVDGDPLDQPPDHPFVVIRHLVGQGFQCRDEPLELTSADAALPDFVGTGVTLGIARLILSAPGGAKYLLCKTTPISVEYRTGMPMEMTEPKKPAREYSGVTSVTLATASGPMTAPAMMESDISIMEVTIMVSVPPSSME